MSNNKINIMNIIDNEDKELLKNNRIKNLKVVDFGKIMSVSNQYIQRNILKELLKNKGYKVYTTDDELPDYITKKLNWELSHNSSGIDIIIESPTHKIIRIQSKLRQVRGEEDYSVGVDFETTRRNSQKNKNKNHTGHICYSKNEFDYVFISLVNVRKDVSKREDCNKWSFCLIPIKELCDKEYDCCTNRIKPEILKKHIVKIEKHSLLYKIFEK